GMDLVAQPLAVLEAVIAQMPQDHAEGARRALAQDHRTVGVAGEAQVKSVLRPLAAHRQSPSAACHSASAATAAVSARRTRGPRLTATVCGSDRRRSDSSAEKPPSGPIRIAQGPDARPDSADSAAG